MEWSKVKGGYVQIKLSFDEIYLIFDKNRLQKTVYNSNKQKKGRCVWVVGCEVDDEMTITMSRKRESFQMNFGVYGEV